MILQLDRRAATSVQPTGETKPAPTWRRKPRVAPQRTPEMDTEAMLAKLNIDSTYGVLQSGLDKISPM